MISSDFPRVAFFDMEGTLLQKAHHLDDGQVAPSAWTLIAEQLGPDCLAAENLTKLHWIERRYSGYLDWMAHTVEIHERFGLTRGTFENVLNSVQLVPGAIEAFGVLHGWGSVSVLITGGFKALADRVQRELKIHHSFAACEYFFDETDGHLLHANLLPADEEGKVDFMKLICREYGVDQADCVFVGDGMNDVHMARAVGFSIAFNAQPQLQAAASVSIEQVQGKEHFMSVIDHLTRERERRTGRGD